MKWKDLTSKEIDSIARLSNQARKMGVDRDVLRQHVAIALRAVDVLLQAGDA